MAIAAAALAGSSAAHAVDYTASTEQELRDRIADANADGDPTSTITLTGNIAITDPTAFPAFTKPVTIDTDTFTLSGLDVASGADNGGTLSFSGGDMLLSGTFRGGNAGSVNSTGTGGDGILLANGSIDSSAAVTGGAGGTASNSSPLGRVAGPGGAGMNLTDSTLINRAAGVITGGHGGNTDAEGVQGAASGFTGVLGGTGVVMTGGSLDNQGAIVGGAGGDILNSPLNADNHFGGTGGLGAFLTGGSHVSSGTITGGQGGIGLNAGGVGSGPGGNGLALAGGATLTNTGAITGGNGETEFNSTRGSNGGVGATVANSTLENFGTITGGNAGGTTAGVGGAGVTGTGGATIVTGGTISGGFASNGVTRGTAVQFTNGGNTLELHAGYAFNGIVLAGAGDTFALGGTTDASFNAAQIAPGAQFRNFGSYQKTGSSTWTLTGTTAVATSWQLLGGTLSVSANTNLGAAAGTLTFNGGILQVTGTTFTSTARTINWGTNGGGFDIAAAANTFTVSQNLATGGALAKLGAGTLVLTGTNGYTGGTLISAGTLQLGNGGASGSIVGDVVNNATLTANRSNDLTLGGTISGSGVLNQIGAGTTILTGNNTYSGLTTISAGTLQLGDGGTSGSIVSDVLNNSVLAFNRSDTFLVPGEISGSGSVEQNGLGTTVLTGDNTYTGGTTISAGTLQLGNGGASGSIVGDVANDGTFAFNRSDIFTYDGIISGTGGVSQIGSGTTILTDVHTYSGPTSISAGTLAIEGSITSQVTTSGLGALAGTGTIFGDVTNGGAVAPGTNAIGTLTIDGNYIGTGGTVRIESVLGDDTSSTDLLVVTGDTSGASNVRVTNVGGPGAPTIEGIKIIDIGGASNGTFSLLGDYVYKGEQTVVGGAYAYRLLQGSVSDPTDGDWYLRSEFIDLGPAFQAGVGVYEALPQTLLSLIDLPTLQQRVGNRYWTGDETASGPGLAMDGEKQSPFWGRVEVTHSRFDPSNSTAGFSSDSDEVETQVGLDMLLHEGAAGRVIGGITAQYGRVSADIASFWGDGEIEANGYGVGGTLTWYGDSGFYVDGQTQLTVFDSDLSTDAAGTQVEGDKGFGFAAGLETGRRFALGEVWALTPQAQLVYARIEDGFTDEFGARVKIEDGDSLMGRLGLSLDHSRAWQDESGQMSRASFYGIANLTYEFLGETEVDVAGTSFAAENERLSGGIGLGGSYSWDDEKFSVYGQATATAGLEDFGDDYSLGGTAGFRMKW